MYVIDELRKGLKKERSTILLIFCIVFLFPIGMVLLIGRLVYNRKSWISSGVILLVLGTILSGVALAGFVYAFFRAFDSREMVLSTLSEILGFFSAGLLFLIPGIIFVRKGLSDRRMVQYVLEEGITEPEDLGLLLYKKSEKAERQWGNLKKEQWVQQIMNCTDGKDVL